MTENHETDRLAEMLGQVPAEVALHLRDLLRGLEAEAGDARARAAEVQQLLEADVTRLQMYAAGLKSKLEDAEAALRIALEEATSAKADLAASRAEVAALEAGHGRFRR